MPPTPESGGALRKALFSIYSYCCLYAIFGILSSSYHAGFNSSLSTLEKRYRFSSETGGYIMITDNVAIVMTNLLIGYYGKNAHKPRWMSVGCIITGLSVLVTALPYFIYGPAQEDDLKLAANITLSTAKNTNQMCLAQPQPVQKYCSESNLMTMVAVACFGLSNFFRGFGTSIYFTMGTPYLDDNVSKAKMPTFFALIFAARIMGAPIGYYLSSTALKFYENPLAPPSGLTPTDPQWIGAWWISFLISGILLLVLSVPLSLFPREFKKKQKNIMPAEGLQLVTKGVANEQPAAEAAGAGGTGEEKAKEDELKLRDLPRDVLAVLKNPIFLCQMMGNLFRGIGWFGHFVFQAKYMESQFRQSASKASLVSGTTGFLGKVFGVTVGGLLVSLVRPGPRFLTTFIFLVEVSSVFTLLYGMQVKGPVYEYPETMNKQDGQLDLFNQCNKKCFCDNMRYQPVCEITPQNNTTPIRAYFSPCHAGCTNKFETIDGGSTYTECGCIKGQGSQQKNLEKCAPDTYNLYNYATIIAVGSMIAGSSRAGTMVTFFRSIDQDQKTMATAVGSFWHSLFVSIPYPIIYGKIFDYTCRVWSYDCNKRGNCWLYDTEKLRQIYHGTSITLIAMGSVFDLIMIFLSPRLGKLYDDEEVKTTIKERLMFWKSKSRRSRRTVNGDTENGAGKKKSELEGISTIENSRSA